MITISGEATPLIESEMATFRIRIKKKDRKKVSGGVVLPPTLSLSH